jgi:hypothetical protein
MDIEGKGIFCTYLVKNNVVPLVLRDYLSLQENERKRSDKLTFYMVHAISPQPRRGCHLGFHACKPCHQSKRGTPRRSRGQHVEVTWIEGPIGTQTASKPHGQLEPTWGPTWQSPRESTTRVGSTGGRTTPRIGRTDLESVDHGLPRGASLFGPTVDSQGV